jgi:pyruvate kinase
MVCTERMLTEMPHLHDQQTVDPQHVVTSAVTQGAADIAGAIGAKLLVVASRSGNTAWVNSKQRNLIPTLGVSNSPATLRRMCLFWGIVPHYIEDFDDQEQLYEVISNWGQQHQLLTPGDTVVMVTGTGIIENAYNQVVVHEVRR